jgi:hypothetical protein
LTETTNNYIKYTKADTRDSLKMKYLLPEVEVSSVAWQVMQNKNKYHTKLIKNEIGVMFNVSLLTCKQAYTNSKTIDIIT